MIDYKYSHSDTTTTTAKKTNCHSERVKRAEESQIYQTVNNNNIVITQLDWVIQKT